MSEEKKFEPKFHLNADSRVIAKKLKPILNSKSFDLMLVNLCWPNYKNYQQWYDDYGKVSEYFRDIISNPLDIRVSHCGSGEHAIIHLELVKTISEKDYMLLNIISKLFEEKKLDIVLSDIDIDNKTVNDMVTISKFPKDEANIKPFFDITKPDFLKHYWLNSIDIVISSGEISDMDDAVLAYDLVSRFVIDRYLEKYKEGE